MCLINDDRSEIILVKLCQTFLPLKGLDRTNRDPVPAPQTGGFRFFKCTAETCRFCDLVRCLIQQLSAVCQDQDPLTASHAFFCHLCENDGLTAAGWQHDKGFIHFFPLFKNAVLCFLLIRTQFHLCTHCLKAPCLIFWSFIRIETFYIVAGTLLSIFRVFMYPQF